MRSRGRPRRRSAGPGAWRRRCDGGRAATGDFREHRDAEGRVVRARRCRHAAGCPGRSRHGHAPRSSMSGGAVGRPDALPASPGQGDAGLERHAPVRKLARHPDPAPDPASPFSVHASGPARPSSGTDSHDHFRLREPSFARRSHCPDHPGPPPRIVAPHAPRGTPNTASPAEGGSRPRPASGPPEEGRSRRDLLAVRHRHPRAGKALRAVRTPDRQRSELTLDDCYALARLHCGDDGDHRRRCTARAVARGEEKCCASP